MNPSRPTLPLVLYEDDHLLAIDKPSGINTHKPGPHAQDGIHEWLVKQRPAWRRLSVLQRLDKETSGVMVFGKSAPANRSLSAQFEAGTIRKTYVFLTAKRPPSASTAISTPIQGKTAQTAFRALDRIGDAVLVEAQPTRGRTHQVRIHAAEAGVPVLGDREHGEPGPACPRLMLHASRLEFKHPATGASMALEAPVPKSFRDRTAAACAREFRDLLFDEASTDSCRLVSAAADGFPGLIVDRFGGAVLVQQSAGREQLPDFVLEWGNRFQVFLQQLTPRGKTQPQPLRGKTQSPVPGPPSFHARENGLQFVIRMDQGFSPGVFPDQRENRRHLRMAAAGKEALNCFAYTCAFSVAAAAGGARTTSLDLSRNYLDWGRDNFRANHLDPQEHDFIYGDVFDWLKRLAARGRQWDIVLLDPPTFGTTKKGRVFRAAKDYGELAALAVKLVRKGGTLFCSTNQRSVTAGEFIDSIGRAVRRENRQVRESVFETQPFDFRVAEGEKPYLKTIWTTLD